jgi:hypothetical protein
VVVVRAICDKLLLGYDNADNLLNVLVFFAFSNLFRYHFRVIVGDTLNNTTTSPKSQEIKLTGCKQNKAILGFDAEPEI